MKLFSFIMGISLVIWCFMGLPESTPYFAKVIVYLIGVMLSVAPIGALCSPKKPRIYLKGDWIEDDNDPEPLF